MSPKLPHKKKKMHLHASGVKEIRDKTDDRKTPRQQSQLLSPMRGDAKQSKLRSYIQTNYMEDAIPFGDSCSRLNQKIECIGRNFQQSPHPVKIISTPKYNQRTSKIEKSTSPLQKKRTV